MNQFFRRNLGFHGRLARGVIGAILLIAGIVMADFQLWVCIALVVAGLFAILEALSGWCLARACGLRLRN